MRRSMLLLAAVLGAVLSACGTGTTAGDPPGDSSATNERPIATVDGEVLVSCGSDGTGWPPSFMTEGLQGALTDDEATRIFQGILSDPMTSEEAALSLFPDGVDVDWRVLDEDDDSLTIGLGQWTEQGPTGGSADILELAREGHAWRAAGWAECQLSPVLKEGNSWAEVSGYTAAAAGARLTAQVHERECTSGRDPDPFLHEPWVVETSETVTIYWTSEPPKGGQDCRGNPSIDRVVELAKPLGTRVVLDGSSYPPEEVPAR